jgi:peptide/nickel transport system permease protein
VGTRRYILSRFVQSLLTLWLIVTLNFFLFRMLPGDPVRLLFSDPRVDLEVVTKLREEFGLDGSLVHQYWRSLVNTARGELGVSFVYKSPVAQILGERLINTVILLLPATMLSILAGCLVGIVAAVWRSRWPDLLGLAASQLLLATPVFWLGLLFIMLAAGHLPLSGMLTPGSHLAGWAWVQDVGRHLVMPLTTLTLVMLGQYALLLRSSLIDVLQEEYMLTARAKGFSAARQLLSHALPNAVLPVMTLAALNLGLLIGGAIQTETVFTWPGVGRLIFEALLTRDYPVLQGAFLVISVCATLATFLSDLLYAAIDPRLQR